MSINSKDFELRSRIKDEVFKDGKLRHKALQIDWYKRTNHLDLLEEIHLGTSFLDASASLRERLYYIEFDLFSAVLCTFCNARQLRLKLGGSLRFYKSCLSPDCQKLCKSQTTSKNWQNQTEEQNQKIRKKIGAANTGKQRSFEVRRAQAIKMKGTKQTVSTISKRVTSRKANGQPWFTALTKQKLSDANRKIHTSPEFRAKYKTVYENSRIKQSETMKEKIANGSFTPPITNSWTHWAAHANKNGKTKRFRSSWEAVFWLLTDFEYEKIRVPYHLHGNNRVYIVDFVDPIGKVIYEIKPDNTRNTDENKAKFEAATAWAKKNGYTFEVIGNTWFVQHITNDIFNENNHLRVPLRQFI
jgi:hypothetical protein